MEEDKSGSTLEQLATSAGHWVTDRQLVKDNIYAIRAKTSQWIANDNIQVIITTGGTGFTGRDSTPEALEPLFDKTIDGFGELFRQISFEEIGSSTIQSRAIAGIANGTLIFSLQAAQMLSKRPGNKYLKTN